MFNFEKLEVYRESLAVVDEVYRLTNNFPKEELFSLTSQLRRATTSITLNIAEGSGRGKKEFSHFLNMARTSCYECASILEIAKRRNYIQPNDHQNFYFKITSLVKMINGLRSYLNQSSMNHGQ
jgi:four helix bundle protein